MSIPVTERGWALTEKEKQTLRLIVRGHDAKSVARTLGLSVHTINERLRDARRKMAVSSSRAAARLLLEAEGDDAASPHPHLLGDTGIGEDGADAAVDQGSAPIGGAGRPHRRRWIITGVVIMTFALALLAFGAFPQATPAPSPAPIVSEPADVAITDAARQWLALVDRGDWAGSYRATAPVFRKLNTLQRWAAASEKVRVPLGTVISRSLMGQQHLPAPPHGYEVVTFRTRFANKPEAVETVTVDHVGGTWRVVGVTIG